MTKAYEDWKNIDISSSNGIKEKMIVYWEALLEMEAVKLTAKQEFVIRTWIYIWRISVGYTNILQEGVDEKVIRQMMIS